MLYDTISCPPEANYVIFIKTEKNYVIDSKKYDDVFSINLLE